VPRHSWTRFPRLRRRDVEESLRFAGSYQHGFWVFAGSDDRPGPRLSPREAGCALELGYANGAVAELNRVPIMVTDAELRDSVMRYFAECEYLSNPAIEACIGLDGGAGEAFIGFNRTLSRAYAAQALVERFGPGQRKPQVSVIVVLHGIGDYLFLQSSIYAQGHHQPLDQAQDQGRDIDAYEFIYVVNSPELIERLHRELRISQMIYGLTQTLVSLPGNAGFGIASNVGVRFARADRLLFLDPHVFPCDPGWARRHLDLLADLPAEQTRLFGTSLYYDDGTLMHGGMYFDLDPCFHGNAEGMTRQNMLRVEHSGKGAPPWASQYVASRAVPAVTGAFLSVDRAWFEKLGGFTEDYVFGDYEDADLCLKSLRAGTPAWLHDIRMLHLEGNGSQTAAQYEGGTLLNRWHFARTWTRTIVPAVLGRDPDLARFLQDNVTPAVQADERDAQSNADAPATRAKRRTTKPIGAASPARAKQRAAKPNDAAPVARTQQRASNPNGAARTNQHGTKPYVTPPAAQIRQRATKPNGTPPAARTRQRAMKATPAPAPTRPAARRPR
jgi:hypothetical protein